ncbi:MAG: protein jag [Thermoleophilia bacterium]|nr:protein jag [Thermoleophilia bacterium]
MSEGLSVEATGETLGEAKWAALRELEALHPGLDKAAVSFQVVSEGERGILGVGYAPARVVATVPPDAVAEAGGPESEGGELVRQLLGRVTAAVGVSCRIAIEEDEETIRAALAGRDLGVLIGRHGQTIDALQYLANAFVLRSGQRKRVVVDAAGYRARREATLETLARRTARRVAETGERVALEAMSPVERRIVHELLKDDAAVETVSEGLEPHRHVVVVPASG